MGWSFPTGKIVVAVMAPVFALVSGVELGGKGGMEAELKQGM